MPLKIDALLGTLSAPLVLQRVTYSGVHAVNLHVRRCRTLPPGWIPHPSFAEAKLPGAAIVVQLSIDAGRTGSNPSQLTTTLCRACLFDKEPTTGRETLIRERCVFLTGDVALFVQIV